MSNKGALVNYPPGSLYWPRGVYQFFLANQSSEFNFLLFKGKFKCLNLKEQDASILNPSWPLWPTFVPGPSLTISAFVHLPKICLHCGMKRMVCNDFSAYGSSVLPTFLHFPSVPSTQTCLPTWYQVRFKILGSGQMGSYANGVGRI